MKLSWSLSYLNRKFSARQVAEWTRLRQRKFEDATGCIWKSWTEHLLVCFLPTWNGITPREYEDPDLPDLLMPHIGRDPITFLRLAEKTGKPLRQVASACRRLCCDQRVIGVVGRTGDCVAVKTGGLTWA